jgi:SpoIIAA-like
MIDYELDKANRVLRVRLESSLDKNDFAELSKAVDPEIENNGDLAGLIIDVPRFPGWDSFGSLVAHIRFVHHHHQHVKKIAVVTDSHLGDLAEHLVSHFVAAEIRQFPSRQGDQARDWIIGIASSPS